MSGAFDLAQAFTGGGVIEDKAYDRRMARLLAAENSRASTEKKLLDAAKLRDEMAARGRLSDSFEGGELDLILSGLASQGKAIEETRGAATKNQASSQALAIAEKLKAAGVDDIDLLNAFIGVSGNKLLGPSNVQVAGQAGADIDYTQAQTAQATAGAEENAAQADLAVAKTAVENAKAEGGYVPSPAVLNSPQMQLLYQGAQDDAPNPDYDPSLPWYTRGNPKTIDIPARDLAPEYMTWSGQMFQQTGDRKYLDPAVAIPEFFATQLSKQDTQDEIMALQEKKDNLYSTRAEVDAAIQAGTLKSGDTFTDPNGVLRRVP